MTIHIYFTCQQFPALKALCAAFVNAMAMEQSNCLLLECTVQLLERLNHARGGKFYYNSDHGYTMDKYKEIRIVPKNCSDGCVWILVVH